MKIITAHGDYFLQETAKSWAKIFYYLEHNNILAPIYFDKKTLQESICPFVDPPFSVITLSDCLNSAFAIKPSSYQELQRLIINQEIICLDVRMFLPAQNQAIAEVFVKMLFYKEEQPKIFILLVEEMHGVEIANIWDQSFFIRADLGQLYNVATVQRKLARKAFLLRWLGNNQTIRRIYKFLRLLKQKIYS